MLELKFVPVKERLRFAVAGAVVADGDGPGVAEASSRTLGPGVQASGLAT